MRLSIDSQRSVAAFTLLEMIAVMALLAAMMTGIFALANGTLQLSSDLRQDRNRDFQIERLDAALRHRFSMLPGNCRFELAPSETTGSDFPELRWWKAESSPLETAVEDRGKTRLVAASTNSAGSPLNKDFSLDYIVEAAIADELISEQYSLFEGISAIQWQLYDSLQQEWTDTWEESRGRPRFIEISLRFADRRPNFRSVYWIPPAINPADIVTLQNGTQPLPSGVPDASGPLRQPALPFPSTSPPPPRNSSVPPVPPARSR